jgi:hypothetical protein
MVSAFLLNLSSEPVNASTEPVPAISANVFYPDTCNPEFWVVFEIANLGSASNANSSLSITLSLHLDFVSWSTKPNDPDMMIRIYDIGETKLDMSGSPIKLSNKIIDLYNFSLKNNESITVTMYFENTSYQSTDEWIKYRLVTYPLSSDVSSTILQDPAESIRKDQEGYSVYQLPVAPNKEPYPIHSDVEVIPEFPSWTILPLLFTTALVIITFKRKNHMQKNSHQ